MPKKLTVNQLIIAVDVDPLDQSRPDGMYNWGTLKSYKNILQCCNKCNNMYLVTAHVYVYKPGSFRKHPSVHRTPGRCPICTYQRTIDKNEKSLNVQKEKQQVRLDTARDLALEVSKKYPLEKENDESSNTKENNQTIQST